MPTMRELKKRLKSVRTTGQLAGAMRTAATAKYARAGAQLNAVSQYAASSRELLAAAASAAQRSERAGEDEKTDGREVRALVLLSGNRGLCGGYNHELFSFFSSVLKEENGDRAVIVCGRMAEEYCREKGIETLFSVAVSDVPDFDQARELSEKLYELYESGAIARADFVFQRFVNMMKQTPCVREFLPFESGEISDDDRTLFIPDAETVRKRLIPVCLAADVYSLLLSCASGAQAATLMAMRSAYDNAMKSAQLLETAINRRRQASVTESVIETSGENHYSY